MIDKPDARVLKSRFSGFQPQRGSPKSAQGKRPTEAPPWVPFIMELEALKGRP